jgi:hypothetical protein
MRSNFTLFVAAWLVASGCIDRDLKPINPCTQSGIVERVRVNNVDKVDLLFMIDNSGSMSEEQASLAMQIPRLVRVLATGDRNPDVDADGDGTPNDIGDDFPAVRSLQIGVVSSDMGVGGFNVDTCRENPNFGDNGLLLHSGNTASSGCMASYPSFLEFERDVTDPDTYARDVNCIAALGTGGCGFEQQLESVLKAVTPSTCNDPWCSFAMNTRGHADGPNLGFLRGPLTSEPESLLAVIMLTDEEDCSVADPAIYTAGDTPNLRCFSNPNMVHATSRFVDGLLATRSSPDLLVFAAIAGVPTNATSSTMSFDQILDAPEMREEIDPTDRSKLRPSCNVVGRGVAYPPRRIVQVARDLERRGASAVIESICQADFTPALNAIIDKFANLLDATCLPRQLNPDESGQVDCVVVETLPATGDVTSCAEIPGRTPIGTVQDAEGLHELCSVRQLTAADPRTDPGWFYETMPEGSSCAQRLTFTEGAQPATGTLVRLECTQPVTPPAGPAAVDIDSPCDPDVEMTCPAAGTSGDKLCPRDYTLSCDTISRTWERTCSTDANCAAGWRCDTSRVIPGAGAICRNPTCG